MENVKDEKIKAMRKSKRKESAVAIALTSPYVIIFVIFSLIPVIMGVVFSFMQYNPYVDGQNKFIGLQNYKDIFNFSNPMSKTFWDSFSTMLVFDIVAVPCLIIIPLALAYFINLKPPGYKIFRAMIYVPSVISITIMGIIFGNMFSGDKTGLINSWLNTEIKWLSGMPWKGDTLRWLVMLIASIWWQTGTNFVIFSGALRNVPQSLYEACEMDGGKRWRKILTVTLPNIKSSITICLFNTLISYLSLYGQPMVFSDVANENIIVSPMMFIQKYLTSGLAYARKTGYIAAAAIIFGLITMAFGVVQRTFTSERVYHSARVKECKLFFESKDLLGAMRPDAFSEVNGAIAVKTKRQIRHKEYKPKKLGKGRVLTKSERTVRREKTVAFAVLFVVAVLFVFPLGYVFGASFKSDIDLQLHPERIFPSAGEWTFDHYIKVFTGDGEGTLLLWTVNSLWSTLATVVLTVIVDLLTAYAVVFMKFKGKDKFMKFLFLWMAVPGVISTTPSFILYAWGRNALDLTGIGVYFYIYFWLIVPGITGIFNMLLMRNFFASIPKEIVESARSDGASTMTVFRRIVAPLAKSTVMLIILFTFTNSWNNLVWPQLLLAGKDDAWMTVTVALTQYTGGGGWGRVGISMASGVFTLIPILIIFCITQNKMIDGLASTGVKM